jgi:hypothetical protein
MVNRRCVLACLAVVLGMAAGGLGLGCYSPNIKDGGLMCAADGSCPSGFTCVANRCVRPDSGLDLLAPPDAPGETSPDQPEVGDGATEMACVQPVAGCTPLPSTTMCDPVCQTGCGCTQKCSVKHDATIACLPLMGPPRATWDTCDIASYGSDLQDDTCVPGDICLQPGGAGGAAHSCFQLCRTDKDCLALAPTGADAAADGAAPPCVSRPVGTAPSGFAAPMARVCDVPYMDCDPVASSGCPMARPDCYLVSPDPVTKADRTICDFVEPDTGGNGRACSSSRDCFEKWTCPTGDVPGAGVCHPVCNIAASKCPAATNGCVPYGTSYGYCM